MYFSYVFLLNETFDPSGEYINFQGYRPGAHMKRAYTGNVQADSAESACEKVFTILNRTYPNDYHERSMSVGDVVNLIGHGTSRFFACEDTGFKEIANPDLTPPNPLWGTMRDYLDNQELYESMNRIGNTHLFLMAVRLARRTKIMREMVQSLTEAAAKE